MIAPEVMLYDDRPCELGEGVFWHPLRRQLFWFDIANHLLLTRDAGGPREWRFDVPVSAGGWIDNETLLIASASALLRFDLLTGRSETVVPLGDDNPATRSNDGRADPWGGFWISTMGRRLEPGAGAMWRYFRGELRSLRRGMTIPNAICFSPCGGWAYFADTPSRVVLRQRLADADGWPLGEAEPFVDLVSEGLNPDGAVVDAEGFLWLAQWGAGRVAVHDCEGRFVGAVMVPSPQVSCPAFGGPDLTEIYITTAFEGMTPAARAAAPQAGMTFRARAPGAHGQAEYRVDL